jgi:hypothetical protein
VAQAIFHYLEGFFPGDSFKFSGTTIGTSFATQRFGQASWTVLLHNPGAAFGADDSLVEGMVWVALDVPYLSFTQCDADTTAASAHVTGGIFNLDTFLKIRF